tara:strand:+ start:285 stop:533 length:249 start_codon:yes stop_codon:yes gene_type:complete
MERPNHWKLFKQYNISCELPSRIITSACLLVTEGQPVDRKLNDTISMSVRLIYKVNNLTSISANLAASKSGIEDADFAMERT